MVMGRLKRMIFRRPVFARTAKRYPCAIDATLVRIDRMTNFEGRIINISTGGAMFRPRRSYLMELHEVSVCLMIDELEVFGHVVSTTPIGYGIRFDAPIADADMQKLVDNHGLNELRSAA